MDSPDSVTDALAALRAGDRDAYNRLFPLVYQELHRAAHHQLAARRPGDTLNTTALVHEAYLKLVGSTRAEFQDRQHFMAVAARAMRQILVDYARRGSAGKRGAGPGRSRWRFPPSPSLTAPRKYWRWTRRLSNSPG